MGAVWSGAACGDCAPPQAPRNADAVTTTRTRVRVMKAIHSHEVLAIKPRNRRRCPPAHRKRRFSERSGTSRAEDAGNEEVSHAPEANGRKRTTRSGPGNGLWNAARGRSHAPSAARHGRHNRGAEARGSQARLGSRSVVAGSRSRTAYELGAARDVRCEARDAEEGLGSQSGSA